MECGADGVEVGQPFEGFVVEVVGVVVFDEAQGIIALVAAGVGVFALPLGGFLLTPQEAVQPTALFDALLLLKGDVFV